MSQIKLLTASSGSIALEPTNTASNLVITVPANAGTMITTASTFAGTGPAFSALLSSNQTITTSTFTKLAFATEVFDTNSNFDTSTYRFTPAVAGYYQVNACSFAATSVSQTQTAIYKNGVLFTRQVTAVASTSSMLSSLIYFNGTTDYIECYGLLVGTTPAVASDSNLTFFQASMVRAV